MKRHGFTILDIMIVVAIIGILATIAIPAYSRYTSQAKTTEAKINLDLIGKGAMAFFATEHPYNHGTKIRSHEYPSSGNSRDGSQNLKSSDSVPPIGGMPYESYNQKANGSTNNSAMWNDGVSQYGIKHNPAAYKHQFTHYPWVDLQFSISAPFYYSYMYVGYSNYTGFKKGGKGSIFTASAWACIFQFCVESGKHKVDGKVMPTDCDSSYIIAGGPHGTVTSILDNSDHKLEELCGRARVDTIYGNLTKKNLYLDNY